MCSSPSAQRASSSARRLFRSGSLAIAGRNMRYGIVCPSTLASSVASSSPALASCALRGVERGQVGVPLVDRLDVELVLVAREMKVVLLQHLGLEAVRAVAIPREIDRLDGRVGHSD